MGSWGWVGYGKYCAVVREGGKSIQNCCVPSIISSDAEEVGEEGEKSIEASEASEASEEEGSRVASAGS